MLKCSFCNKKPIYKYKGKYYCEEHFLEYFEKKVFETIEKFNLIEPGEKIGVAVSGGKDSTSLFYFLWEHRKELGIEVVGIHIDEGIEGYRPILTEHLKNLAKKFGWKIYIYSFKELFGFTLDEAVRKIKDLKPCTICGVLRRWIMNKAAKELKLDKIATAHNLNDEAQTVILNILEGNLKDLARGGPYVGVKRFEGFVPRIKPFYFCLEKETTIYSILKDIYPPFTECPYIVGQIRHIVRRKMYIIESKYEGFYEKIIENYLKILPKLKEKFKGIELKPCKICGEPTSREICRKCEIINKLLEKL